MNTAQDKSKTFFRLIQLSQRLHFRLRLAVLPLDCEGNWRAPSLCRPEKIIGLCVHVGGRVGEGRDWSAPASEHANAISRTSPIWH